jgi:hypothetical protein
MSADDLLRTLQTALSVEDVSDRPKLKAAVDTLQSELSRERYSDADADVLATIITRMTEYVSAATMAKLQADEGDDPAKDAASQMMWGALACMMTASAETLIEYGRRKEQEEDADPDNKPVVVPGESKRAATALLECVATGLDASKDRAERLRAISAVTQGTDQAIPEHLRGQVGEITDLFMRYIEWASSQQDEENPVAALVTHADCCAMISTLFAALVGCGRALEGAPIRVDEQQDDDGPMPQGGFMYGGIVSNNPELN